MFERTMSHLYHIMNILSGLEVAPISGSGAMLDYLAIVELWIIGYLLVMWSYRLLAIFWSCGVMGHWLFLVMWSYAVLVIFGHVEL